MVLTEVPFTLTTTLYLSRLDSANSFSRMSYLFPLVFTPTRLLSPFCPGFLPSAKFSFTGIFANAAAVPGCIGPGQLPADIGPTTGKATYEEYGIDHSQIGLGRGKRHHE